MRNRAIFALVGMFLFGAMVGTATASSDHAENEGAGVSLITEMESLTQQASELWPEQFGSSWLMESGKPHKGMVLGFTSGADEKVKQLAEHFSRPSLLAAVTVPKSEPQISREMDLIIDDRGKAKGGFGPLVDVDQGMFDMDADLKTGEILVLKPDVTDEERVIMSRTYPGSKFRFEEQPLGVFDACNSREDCIPHLRAGIQARKVASPFGQKGCSTGFTVWSNSKAQILSAAHCSPKSKWNTNSSPYDHRWSGLTTSSIGPVARNRIGGTVDVERISTSPGFYARGWIYRNDTTKEWPVEDQGTWASLVSGSTICRSGNTTGFNCGNVIAKHYSPTKYRNDAVKFARTDGCSEGGDSGGPWFRVNKAWGIHSGSIPLSPSCGGPMQNFFGLIDFALEAMNAQLVFYTGG